MTTKKKAALAGTGTASKTFDSPNCKPDSTFRRVRNALAINGFNLLRTDPRDGEPVFILERGGLAQVFTGLQSLIQLAGQAVADEAERVKHGGDHER